jgi:hypothetical protein
MNRAETQQGIDLVQKEGDVVVLVQKKAEWERGHRGEEGAA